LSKLSRLVLLALGCAAIATSSSAQDVGGASLHEEKEPVAILEVGASGEQTLDGHGFNLRPTFAAEAPVVEDLLSVEAGVTPTFHSHSTEWETDFLVKKPWTVSRSLEITAGIGPTWVHSTARDDVRDAVGGEAALEFLFWPTGEHRFGWYVEPAYDRVFTRDHPQSVGLTIGRLVGIP
jgi:hypothetical protein